MSIVDTMPGMVSTLTYHDDRNEDEILVILGSDDDADDGNDGVGNHDGDGDDDHNDDKSDGDDDDKNENHYNNINSD